MRACPDDFNHLGISTRVPSSLRLRVKLPGHAATIPKVFTIDLGPPTVSRIGSRRLSNSARCFSAIPVPNDRDQVREAVAVAIPEGATTIVEVLLYEFAKVEVVFVDDSLRHVLQRSSAVCPSVAKFSVFGDPE